MEIYGAFNANAQAKIYIWDQSRNTKSLTINILIVSSNKRSVVFLLLCRVAAISQRVMFLPVESRALNGRQTFQPDVAFVNYPERHRITE